MHLLDQLAVEKPAWIVRRAHQSGIATVFLPRFSATFCFFEIKKEERGIRRKGSVWFKVNIYLNDIVISLSVITSHFLDAIQVGEDHANLISVSLLTAGKFYLWICFCQFQARAWGISGGRWPPHVQMTWPWNRWRRLWLKRRHLATSLSLLHGSGSSVGLGSWGRGLRPVRRRSRVVNHRRAPQRYGNSQTSGFIRLN